MTSFRQIDANRRNAQLSSGPKTEEGKTRSRRNAIRHGLTAETVIDALEDADDYAAFELAVTSDYDASTAVERELVLRLASLLWRLRRANLIESGLFKIHAQHLRNFRQQRRFQETSTNSMSWFSVKEDNIPTAHLENSGSSDPSLAKVPDDLTQSYVRLSNLPTFPLDRLSRYEATLWRQACQILLTLRGLDIRRA
jgi:hypothetical protein